MDAVACGAVGDVGRAEFVGHAVIAVDVGGVTPGGKPILGRQFNVVVARRTGFRDVHTVYAGLGIVGA